MGVVAVRGDWDGNNGDRRVWGEEGVRSKARN